MNHSPWIRALSLTTALAQVVGAIPLAAAPASEEVKKKPPEAVPVKANRTPPRAIALPSTPAFSSTPTDLELRQARVFEEPLIPIGRATTPEENSALAAGIMAYFRAGGGEDVSPFESFLATYPETPWRGALLTNLGIVYRRTGYFSKALTSWEAAWMAAKVATDATGNALADRALAELAELNARLGRFDRLEALFAEIGSRDVHGSAGERVSQAREGLAKMRETPGEAFRCGPMAIDRILAYANPNYRPDPRITHARSTQRGTSLLQVQKLARTVGLNLQVAFRSPSARPVVPAVVHWKAGHFAALVAERNGRYLLQDPTFGNDLWVSRRALDEEASGYALIPIGPLAAGWRPVTDTEGTEVWGKGFVSSGNNQNQGSNQKTQGGKPSCCGCPPMAEYRVHAMLVSLNVTDEPVGYTPPVGGAVAFSISYHQREVFQPQVPAYGNLGPKWTYGWLSFLEDNPTDSNAPVNVYMRGGGQETYPYDTSSQSYTVHPQSRAGLVWAPRPLEGMPVRYERQLPDGSIEVFAQSDGAPSAPRKVYLTSWSDSQGNTVRLTYNGLKLVSVTDAIGQVTTLFYELPADPLKITKVTDPFGRFATFEYNAQGQLQKSTDVIGIASEFAYGTSDFITALTTPYGTTRFTTGTGAGQARWVEATDPLGAVERIESIQGAPGISPSDPSNTVPTGEGVLTYNQYLDGRNTFFWDKRASSVDAIHHYYAKAVITHWAHDVDASVSSGIVESEKNPLENRVWYVYPGQTNPAFVSAFTAAPSTVARVLDDGSSQVYRYEYNSKGKKIKETDPLGRETVYVYGTGSTPDADQANGTGIDLLQAKQKNGAGYDLLWSATYNAQHRPLTVTDAAAQMSTYTYNTQGQLLTAETPARAGITENRTTTSSYDSVTGHLLSVTGPATGLTKNFTYDGYGRVQTITDVPDDYTVTIEYDALDRTKKVTYPDTTYEEVIYNRLDAEKRRDRLGRWVHTFYDALRRPVAIRDALGRTTTQQWCNCGSLDKIVDPNNNATTWERDLQGRVTKEIRADASFSELVYETTTSRLKTSKDPKQQATEYTYNRDNTLASLTYKNALGQPDPNTPAVSYSYDPNYRRIATRSDGVGTTTYGYNPIATPPALGAGRVASVDGPIAGTTDQVTYGYDELSRAVNQTLNGATISQSYDVQGRIVGETNSLGSFTYGYVGLTGRLSNVVYPNGQTIAYDYLTKLGDFRLKEIHNKRAGGATLSKFNYATDVVGRISTWTQQADASAAKAYDFEYDLGDQLTAATLRTTDPTPAILKRFRYAYDKGWNRTTEQIDDGVVGASFSNLNALTTQQPSGSLRFAGAVNETATVTVQATPAQVGADLKFAGAAQVGSGTSTVAVTATDPSGNVRTNTYQVSESGATKTFTHDTAGNLSADGTRTLEWDALNRLIAVNSGTLRTEYTYDGVGHRSRIVVKDNGSVVTDRRYIWVGPGSEERDAAGTNVLKRFFSQGVQEGTNNFFFTRDHLGSIRELSDNGGVLQGRYDYDPFGRATRVAGTRDTDFGFTGHFRPGGSGLLLTPQRAYDADLGRWLNPDPIGVAGGINVYGYVLNDPANLLDPTGQGPTGAAIGGAIGGALGIGVGASIGGAIGGAVGLPTGPGAAVTAAAGAAAGAAAAAGVAMITAAAGAAVGDAIEDLWTPPPPVPVTPPSGGGGGATTTTGGGGATTTMAPPSNVIPFPTPTACPAPPPPPKPPTTCTLVRGPYIRPPGGKWCTYTCTIPGKGVETLEIGPVPRGESCPPEIIL